MLSQTLSCKVCRFQYSSRLNSMLSTQLSSQVRCCCSCNTLQLHLPAVRLVLAHALLPWPQKHPAAARGVSHTQG